MTNDDSADSRPDAGTTSDTGSPLPTTGRADVEPRRFARIGWLSLTIAILFGLFYAYDLFEAISNVVGVTSQITLYNEARAVVKLDPVPIPWGWLVIDVLLAPVVFALAVFIGRRKAVLLRVLLFVVGLTLVAAATLSVEALA
ncbi:hypothetical protein [Frigoribacterium sp. CG_9.8]|uniref:hypothetical protein n=1 Tax=Frigoribacterium sp. CG_9.8 TaxID=2787733 RepID=UPI0018C98176|nr:hypothetical protein [Frigoribacterium sp. CG_9.8]MBG6106876.1 putative paraquat-inducible protein A [Frigoribacterium sp. CG_9.8]